MLGSTLLLLTELLALFVGVSFGVEILQRRLGPERVQSWMSGRPVVAAIKGIAIGFVTPFCTYSAVPLLVGLRRAGVPPAGYVAFISAAPVLDPVLFGALFLIVGPTIAVTYLLVTFVAALGLALAAQRFGIERHLRAVAAPTRRRQPVRVGGRSDHHEIDHHQECASVSNDRAQWAGWAIESRWALEGSRQLLRRFAPMILIGVGLGLAIEAVVPADSAVRLTSGTPWLSIPAASALGTPLYFSTELLVPIANSLKNAGVGVGAIVALTIAGAGANIPEFVVLSKMARPRVISAFFAYVFLVAVAGGGLAHLLSST